MFNIVPAIAPVAKHGHEPWISKIISINIATSPEYKSLESTFEWSRIGSLTDSRGSRQVTNGDES